MVEYIKKSPSRVTPPCDYFEICGGCSLQHMSTASQIEHKQQTLLNHLKYIGNDVEPENILPPLYTNNTEDYRNKARLGVRYVTKKSKVIVGFRERNGRFLADIDKCMVLNPLVGEKLTEIASFYKDSICI